MTDENAKLRAASYQRVADNLENFLILVQEHAQDNTYVQKAYAELPESVKQGRTLEDLAVDEITDVLVAITYSGHGNSTLYKYYRELRNAFTESGASAMSEADAREELKQHYAGHEDIETSNIIIPNFLKIILENISLADLEDVIQSWPQVMQEMAYCAQDNASAAVFYKYEGILTAYMKALEVAFASDEDPDYDATEDAEVHLGEDSSKAQAYAENGALDSQDPYAQFGLSRPDEAADEVNREMQHEQKKQILYKIKEKYYEYIAKVDKELSELGEDIEPDSELAKLKKSVESVPLPDDVRKGAESLLKKLEGLIQQHPEYSGGVTFLKKLVAWPWGQYSDTYLDTGYARDVLDTDHYGLESVKERILEEVAIQKRTKQSTPSVICLSGPPGVGKTSIARSLAKAMGREFVSSSLAGVNEASHISGRSPSLKDAAPGKIFNGTMKAGTKNPLFLLDEIDKLSTGDIQGGDPSSALLAVFDPEQNSAFKDNFMGDDVAFDLSQVMFVTTANDPSKISIPLKDRMYMIELEPYVTEEKLEIGKRFLAPRQKKDKGVDNTGLVISDDALRDIIVNYAPEAGVRKLDQKIGRICAQHAKAIEEGAAAEGTPFEITADNLEDYLGAPLSTQEVKNSAVEKGVVHGLAASDLGGSVLEIKAVNKPGDGKGFKLETTAVGDIGGMMERSAKVASAYIQSNHEELGISQEQIQNTNLHVHVVDAGGGIDGPSAGAAFTTTILSAAVASAKGREIRSDVAMTGTVEPDGKVGKIGGLKQKLDAARNNPNISTVLIPKQNEGELRKVPQPIRDALTIVPVSAIDEVLTHALHDYQPAAVNDDKPDSCPQGTSQAAWPANNQDSLSLACLSCEANVQFKVTPNAMLFDDADCNMRIEPPYKNADFRPM